jgi:short subunit dehydrogenase-like uncharacterized protein
MSEERDLDIVVLGATGFVGRLLAEYLAEHAPKDVRVGLSGRSEERLAGIRDGLGPKASGWPLLVCDSADPKSLAAVAGATRVLTTTVGPYRRNGINVVEACVDAGTDYADLTGEVLFMRETIDRFHDRAARSGVRIVHSCGFDSIPSDLGTLLLHQRAQEDNAGDLEDTTFVLTSVRGGLSGGTLASGQGEADEVRADPRLAKVVGDPYALSPDRAEEPDLGDEREQTGARRDSDLRTWTAPFIMASTNTRAVRRSNALQGWAYGRAFRYREVMGFGDGPRGRAIATGLSAGIAAMYGGLNFGLTRTIMGWVMPSPGEGPSEKLRRTGYYRIQIHTRTSSGARYVARVEARGDPGYGATSVMLGESSLCLALDRDKLPARGGVLTPSTAMGTVLVDRLRAAGQTFAVERAPD